MPNHVRNVVKMEGINELSLFRVFDDGTINFDFNKIIEMPKSLDIESGSITENAIVYFVTNRCSISPKSVDNKYKDILNDHVKNSFCPAWTYEVFMRVIDIVSKMTSEEKDELYKKGEIYVSNIINYGFPTWYEWCIENWGTKWNAYDTERIGDDTVIFKTAWSNPEPIMINLSKTYPDKLIKHWWADEDYGNNTGHRIYRNGDIISGDYVDNGSDEAYSIYNKCWF